MIKVRHDDRPVKQNTGEPRRMRFNRKGVRILKGPQKGHMRYFTTDGLTPDPDRLVRPLGLEPDATAVALAHKESRLRDAAYKLTLVLLAKDRLQTLARTKAITGADFIAETIPLNRRKASLEAELAELARTPLGEFMPHSAPIDGLDTAEPSIIRTMRRRQLDAPKPENPDEIIEVLDDGEEITTQEKTEQAFELDAREETEILRAVYWDLYPDGNVFGENLFIRYSKRIGSWVYQSYHMKGECTLKAEIEKTKNGYEVVSVAPVDPITLEDEDDLDYGTFNDDHRGLEVYDTEWAKPALEYVCHVAESTDAELVLDIPGLFLERGDQVNIYGIAGELRVSMFNCPVLWVQGDRITVDYSGWTDYVGGDFDDSSLVVSPIYHKRRNIDAREGIYDGNLSEYVC